VHCYHLLPFQGHTQQGKRKLLDQGMQFLGYLQASGTKPLVEFLVGECLEDG
jgi:hypothetical protein